MQLRYILLLAAATLATASSTTSAASGTRDPKTPTVASNHHIEKTVMAQADHEFMRSLLEDDDNSATQGQTFMEHKLKKMLTNPKKAKQLYQHWHKKGYTAKQVASDLGQTENRALDQTYKKIAKEYAAFVKEQSV
ncbi:RXLR effector domain-containing protein [Phytophthora infestans]|uniref:RxLR effector protein n=1 Tax=Phytophthora infestans TaxID=4787 RepID=A0A8S9UXA6_PHYIN|nr:RXLR effector domain-containing protein [Phytophthora infestans]